MKTSIIQENPKDNYLEIISNANRGLNLESFIESYDENSDNQHISVNETNYVVSENEINQARKSYLNKEILPLFISLLKYEEYEFGRKSESIRIVQRELAINKIVLKEWLNEIYINSYSGDERILIGILRIFEYFEEQTFSPNSKTILLSSLVHENDEIKELAIRVFEKWVSFSSYDILKKVKTDTPWLNKYLSKVLSDLKLDLCLS